MKQNDNLLDYVPRRTIAWEQGGDERVYLIKDRARSRWFKKFIRALKVSEHIHIHLDEFGSAAWLEADGARSILEISRALQQRFGERMNGAEQRTAWFFAQLRSHKFVELLPPAATKPEM